MANPPEDAAASDPDGDAIAELSKAIKKVRSAGLTNPNLRPPDALLRALGVDLALASSSGPRVARALVACASRLDKDTREHFLLAAGAYKGATGSPGERIRQTEIVLSSSRRTVYRKIDEAADGIARQLILKVNAPHLEGLDFITTSTRCRLDLRGDSPTILLDRTVFSLHDGFDSFDEQIILPLLTTPTLNYYALEGCALDEIQRDYSGVWSVRLRFPRPLKTGENHDFSVSLRLPDHESLEPLMAFAPVTHTTHAHLEFRFAERLPRRIERIDRVRQLQLLSPSCPAQAVTPITAVTTVDFEQMQPGWGYGVRWVW